MIFALRCLGWLVVVAIVAFTVSPIGLRPTTAAPAHLERFVAFALAAGALTLGYPRKRWLMLLLVIGVAGALELLQQLVPSRHGELDDLIIKVLGAIAGATLASLALPA